MLLLLLPLLAVAVVQPYCTVKVHTATNWQALMNPVKQKSTWAWLGADVATSLSLTKHRYIWLFGDTLIGTCHCRKRLPNLNYFIHNSVGENRCVLGGKHCTVIKKYFRLDNSKRPEAIFRANKKNHYLWPSSGAMLGKKLFLVAANVSKKGLAAPLGTSFIIVDNPTDKPNHWHYHVYDVFSSAASIRLSTSVVRQGRWLYLFGSKRIKNIPKTNIEIPIIARISLISAKSKKWQALHYWSSTKKTWLLMNGASAMKGFPLMSEASIAHNSYFGWYTVHIPFGSFSVHLYTAKHLVGPWKDQGVIYQIPDKWRNASGHRCTALFMAYAAKVHPQLAHTQRQIVLSYNININFNQDKNLFFQFMKKPAYTQLYVPQFVSIFL